MPPIMFGTIVSEARAACTTNKNNVSSILHAREPFNAKHNEAAKDWGIDAVFVFLLFFACLLFIAFRVAWVLFHSANLPYLAASVTSVNVS